LADSNSIVTIWQKLENERQVFQGICKNIDHDNQRMFFECDKELSLSDSEVFFYSEEHSMIFKISDFNFEENFLDTSFPEELISLSQKENDDYALKNKKIRGTTQHFKDETMSLESKRERIKTEPLSGRASPETNMGGLMVGAFKTEKISSKISANLKTEKISTKQSVKSISEDEAFEHHRSTPRARPKSQKRVTFHIKGKPETSKEYELFDLSMGGMSFVITSRDLLSKNDELEFTYFDDNAVSTLMIGIIRNIREEAPDRFKVGVQFISEE
jgi:hypothetical protein